MNQNNKESAQNEKENSRSSIFLLAVCLSLLDALYQSAKENLDFVKGIHLK